MADDLLGGSYFDTDEFKARAGSFGCSASAVAAFSDDELDAVLASASRAIEGYTNRSFNPNPQTEIQRVDFYTRRIRVDKPPVVSISQAKLKTYPADTTLDYTQWTINNQEGYIEIPIAQLGGGTYVYVSEYPDVSITYVSGQTLPPPAVLTAVGFVAADIINRNYINQLTFGGLISVETGDQKLQRAPFDPGVKTISETARQILANDPAFSPRVTPRGYPQRYVRGGPQYRVP